MVPLFCGNPQSSNSDILHNFSKNCFFESFFIAPRLLGFRSPLLTASGPDLAHATLIEKMANRHSLMWRAPGRRSAEREKFRRLMKKVEAVRVREGMTKTELAAELGANVDGVRAWMTGRTVGRKETVDKIKDFLKRKS